MLRQKLGLLMLRVEMRGKLTSVRTVNSCTKSVTDSEFHYTGNQLRSSSHEKRKTENDLVGANRAE
jgi:hypothetical protein